MPLVLDPSCDALSSLQKAEARQLYDRASAMLTAAHVAMIRIDRDLNEQRRFARWFGSYSRAAMTAMKRNIDELHRALVTLPCAVVWCADGMADGQPVDGAIACVFRNSQRVRIYLFPPFFEQAVHGSLTEAGTVVHELSHCVLGTRDHAYYAAACQRLAVTNPLFARSNADSYQLYCEEFPA